MGCEEEELAPWQEKVGEDQEDDHDASLLVAKTASIRPAISNIFKQSQSQPTFIRIRNVALNQAITASFKPVYKSMLLQPNVSVPCQ